MLAVRETNEPFDLSDGCTLPYGRLVSLGSPQLKTRSIASDDSDSAGARRTD